MRIYFFLILICFTASCSKYWYKPYGRIFDNMPKGGSPGFNLGWEHGCYSGLGTQFGGSIYQSFYTWQKDVDIASANPSFDAINRVKTKYKKELAGVNWNDPADIKRNFSDYNTVFWNVHQFCRHSVLGILQISGMDPPNPAANDRYLPGAHSVGNVWKINARGDTRIGNTGFW